MALKAPKIVDPPEMTPAAPESLYPPQEVMVKGNLSVNMVNRGSEQLRNKQAAVVHSFVDSKISRALIDLRNGYIAFGMERRYMPEAVLKDEVRKAKTVATRMRANISEYAGTTPPERLRGQLEGIWRKYMGELEAAERGKGNGNTKKARTKAVRGKS